MTHKDNMDFYPSFISKDAQEVTLEHVADILCSNEELKKNTMLFRDLMAQGNDKAAKAVKEATP